MADKNEIHTEAISALSSFGSRAPSDEEAEEFIDSLTVSDEAVSDEIKDALLLELQTPYWARLTAPE